MGLNKIYNGDCLEIMKHIPDGSVDMVLCDLPYGTTTCAWDNIIPFEPLWKEYERVIKDNGAIVLFGQEPFSSMLRVSNIKLYKYDWIWNKTMSPNFMMAKYAPLKTTELISVFSKGGINQNTKNKMAYYPQGIVKCDKDVESNVKAEGVNRYNKLSNKHKQTQTNYPKNVLTFSVERGFHPTQKPVKLLEYLIRTYTLENETVLDNTMGSGSTGVACVKSNRNFIGIELDENYFNIAKDRIENATVEKKTALF